MTSIVDKFSQMLIATSSLGIYITQENGHRYINVDVRELSYRHPEALANDAFSYITDIEALEDPIYTIKHYGSFLSALYEIESWLSEKLTDIYDNLNYADTIIGMGEVE